MGTDRYHERQQEGQSQAAPAAKPKAVQRVRVRQCSRKLHTLTDNNKERVTYVCQLERGHEGLCLEKGVVILDNGYGLAYTMAWDELGPYEARRMRDRIQ